MAKRKDIVANPLSVFSPEQIAALSAMLAQQAGGAVPAENPTNLVNQTPSPLPKLHSEPESTGLDLDGFPASKTAVDAKTGETVRKMLPVRPVDRKLFMALARKQPWALKLETSVNGKTVQFDITADCLPKAYSSGDHGMMAQKASVNIVFPSGEEFTLTGQCILNLARRVH